MNHRSHLVVVAPLIVLLLSGAFFRVICGIPACPEQILVVFTQRWYNGSINDNIPTYKLTCK
jgi:hypothetical protein